MYPILKTAVLPATIGLLALCSGVHASAITLTFDEFSGMANGPGLIVPLESQLSDQFLTLHGVSFRSDADYVAVVDHSSLPGCGDPGGCPTVSEPNIIGGVLADGTLSYGTPLTISFFVPANPTEMGTTDFVKIRGELVPLPGASASMEAFDLLGRSIGLVTDSDSASGLSLSIAATGIHSIVLRQDSAAGSVDGTIGFDNLEFNMVVPEPGTGVLVGVGLLLLRGRRQYASEEKSATRSSARSCP